MFSTWQVFFCYLNEKFQNQRDGLDTFVTYARPKISQKDTRGQNTPIESKIFYTAITRMRQLYKRHHLKKHNFLCYLKAQPMQSAVTASQKNHPTENGLERWARILRAPKRPHRLNKIIIDSSKMNRDCDSRAVSKKTGSRVIYGRTPRCKTFFGAPNITRHPAKAPAQGERPNWQRMR